MKFGLLIALLLIIVNTAKINKVVLNRMQHDVNSTLETREILNKTVESNYLNNLAKTDLYRSTEGYYNDEGNFLENPTTLEPTNLNLTSFSLIYSPDPLFISSDRGSALTQPFNNFEWDYTTNNLGWDGSKFNNLPNEDELKDYFIYRLYVNENYLEGLKYLYSIEFYTPLSDNLISGDSLNLENGVGILIKMNNGSVESYTILNSLITDYNKLRVIDFYGKVLVEVHKELLTEIVNVGEDMLDQVTGHLIIFNHNNPNYLKANIYDSNLVRVKTDFGEQEYTDYNNVLEIDMGTGLNKIEFEIFGTDVFAFELGYNRVIRN